MRAALAGVILGQPPVNASRLAHAHPRPKESAQHASQALIKKSQYFVLYQRRRQQFFNVDKNIQYTQPLSS